MALKKIAIVSSSPIPNQVPIWRALARHGGIDVCVFYAAGSRPEPVDKKEAFATLDDWDLDLTSGYNNKILENKPKLWLNKRYRFNCPDIKKELKKEKYSAMLIVGKEYIYYLQAIKAAYKQRIPILYKADIPPPKTNKAGLFIANLHRKLLYPKFSAFLILGKTQYRYYSDYGVPGEKMFWAPYCVDNSFFQKEADKCLPLKDKIREKLGFDKETRVVVFAGRFAEIKRPMDLLYAFKLLESKGDYGLLLLGDGKLKPECEEYVLKNNLKRIRFAGFKNTTEISEMYAAGDCIVLPSRNETWGLVINEAMNFGLPVIVTDKVGCGPDLVIPGENGFVYPMGDVNALAESIMNVFENNDKKKTMGVRSKEIVSEYSVETNVQGILEAVEYVSSAGRP
jgi:glycosyltransferase involved in cell wall biosynthesis